MNKDPVIEAIRNVREQISAEYGNDTRSLLDHYKKMEKEHEDRMIPVKGVNRSA